MSVILAMFIRRKMLSWPTYSSTVTSQPELGVKGCGRCPTKNQRKVYEHNKYLMVKAR